MWIHSYIKYVIPFIRDDELGCQVKCSRHFDWIGWKNWGKDIFRHINCSHRQVATFLLRFGLKLCMRSLNFENFRLIKIKLGTAALIPPKPKVPLSLAIDPVLYIHIHLLYCTVDFLINYLFNDSENILLRAFYWFENIINYRKPIESQWEVAIKPVKRNQS